MTYELLKSIREQEAGTEARADWWGWLRRHWRPVAFGVVVIGFIFIVWR